MIYVSIVVFILNLAMVNWSRQEVAESTGVGRFALFFAPSGGGSCFNNLLVGESSGKDDHACTGYKLVFVLGLVVADALLVYTALVPFCFDSTKHGPVMNILVLLYVPNLFCFYEFVMAPEIDFVLAWHSRMFINMERFWK